MVLPLITVIAFSAGASAKEDVTVLSVCDDDAFAQYGSRLAANVANGSAREVSDAPSCFSKDEVERRGQLNAGRKAFESLDIDGAVQSFRGLLADIAKAPHVESDLSITQQAMTYLAWIALERHDTSGARTYFESACALGPRWAPDIQQFPPQVTQEVARVCGGMKSNATFRFEEHATLRVDEKNSCTGPCELKIPPGTHFVVVDNGHIRRDLYINAKGGHKTLVEASLMPTDIERLRHAVRAADSVALAPSMGSAGTDGVVIIDRVSTGVVAVLGYKPFESTYGPLALTGDPASDAVTVNDGLTSLRIASMNGTKKPVWKRWWFWTGVGVVAAGATTGIILAATHQDRQLSVAAALP